MVTARRLRTAAAVCALVLAGCSGDGSAVPTGQPSAAEDVAATASTVQQFPDIVQASLVPREDGTYDVAVTVSSPYDTPQRYADGWRVLSPDGEVLGSHTLLHDHANEQPFTRTQRGLVVPDGISNVTIEGRDLEYGYGGGTVVVAVPAS